jgi:hypothetical protein
VGDTSHRRDEANALVDAEAERDEFAAPLEPRRPTSWRPRGAPGPAPLPHPKIRASFTTLVPCGVALSPAPIIELILVLFSRRARVNGIVFVLTLLATTFAVAAIGALVLRVSTDNSTDQPSAVKGVVLVIIGLLVVALAARNWRQRRDTSVPRVFGSNPRWA